MLQFRHKELLFSDDILERILEEVREENPYQQRMDFLQGYQQSLQRPVQMLQTNQQMNVLGKIVDSIEVVKTMYISEMGICITFQKWAGQKFLENGGL